MYFDSFMSCTAHNHLSSCADGLYAAVDHTGHQAVGGMCGTVGPVGFSLGGGHGPIIRSHGLGADNIVSAKLVLAEGSLVEVSEAAVAADPALADLWWALRGGGGGTFGVVVEIAVRRYEAPASVSSLTCDWPLNSENGAATPGRDLLEAWWSGLMQALPDEWAFFTIGLPAPIKNLMKDMEKYDSKTMQGLVSLEGVYNGEYSDAMLEAVAGVMAFQPENQIKCYTENFTSLLAWHESRWFGAVPVPMRDTMATSFAQPGFNATALAGVVHGALSQLGPNSLDSFFGIQTGGQVSEVAGDATSVSPAFRSAELIMETDSNWLTRASDAEQMAWTQATGGAVAAVAGMEGSYVNEPDPELSDWEALFWGEANFARLQDIKRALDPGEFFSCHQCVYN
jgi:FAD/FMN-containing dehydrogenase